MNDEVVPFTADDSLADQLREVFARHGYNEDAIRERLDGADVNRLSLKSRPRLLAQTSGATPLDVLIRLFVLRTCVGEADACRALEPVNLVSMLRGGLLKFAMDGVESLVRIRPFAGNLFVFDPSDAALRRDHVLGPGRASNELHNATVRLPFMRALDLGTGCGMQGVSCAAHCGHVVSTDINPRAVAMTRFNARLNGRSNVEVRTGSLFEPVASEVFDLVVMNMPYAIGPGVKFMFRDSGAEGDAFLQKLVREVPGHLATGGFCIATAQWAQIDGEPWRERLWRWFRGLPLDVWILRQSVQPAAKYVEGWIAETEQPGDANRWQEWTTYLRERRIGAIHTGLACLRRREQGEGWFSITDDVSTISPGASDDILTGFQLRDFLADCRDDAALLGQCYRTSPRLRVTKTIESAEQNWRTVEIVLRNQGGLSFSRKVDENALAIIQRLDGRKTLGEVVDQFAAEARVDWAVLTEHVVAMVRTLVEQGFILPASGS